MTSMKHKVSEIEGALLDAAVAKAEGHTALIDGREVVCMAEFPGSFAPSRTWADGGPIIERELIHLLGRQLAEDAPERWQNWFASLYDQAGSRLASASGPTPLIAAMRAYVSSKFGEEVELP